MKLKTIFFAVGIVLIASSCFKTRNCKCTTVDSNGETSVTNESFGGSDGVLPGSNSKKSQEAECKSQESSNSYSTTTCELSK